MNLRDRFERLEDREKKLLLIFGSVLVVMLVLIIPIYAIMSVADGRAENERIIEIIREIKDERVTLSRRKAETKRVDSRYARKAPALASFLAQAADQVGVDIPETQDRSTVPAGKAFKERATKIRLRKIGMLALSNFLEKVESSGYPLSVSKLNIKKGTKPDEYDVEMDVSAFDREEAKKKPKVASGSDTDEEDAKNNEKN